MTISFIYFIRIRHLWVEAGEKGQLRTRLDVLFPRERQLRWNAAPLQAPAAHPAIKATNAAKAIQDPPQQ